MTTPSSSPTRLLIKRLFSISWKRFLWAGLILFLVANIIAYNQAYKFTHFSDASLKRTEDPDQLTISEKLEALFFGIRNPRPENQTVPNRPYTVINVNNQLEAWLTPAHSSKGIVIMFHGYASKKSSLLTRSYAFLELGYSVLLVDFAGSGGSQGNTTSIGFHEASQVKACFDYLKSTGENNIYLFGTSMGSAAILKSLHDSSYQPKGIILECPFGSLYKTTCARFEMMNLPSFPMAGLLVFWGGIQNNYWAFGHNPSTYAKDIHTPTLIIYGLKDDRVSKQEINEIYNNLQGEKHLKIYPEAGHNDLFSSRWHEDVKTFLKEVKPNSPSDKKY